MSEIKLHFQLTENFNAEKLTSALGKQVALQIVSQQVSLKTFFDSFDWRLFGADLLCELNQSKSASQLSILDLKNGQVLATADMGEVPLFAHQFSDETIKNKLTSLLETRALMSLTSLTCQTSRINILNKDQKTTVRLLIEDCESLPARVHIQPLKGYDKAARDISQLLEKS